MNSPVPYIMSAEEEGRPFLRTVGAVIDMKEGNIKFQLPLKKVWNTSLGRR